MPGWFGVQIKNYVDGTTGSVAMMTKWGCSYNEPVQLFGSSRWLFAADWGGSADGSEPPTSVVEAWHSVSLAAQHHGEAPWKHLTCYDSEALFKCLPAALHQIRGLRCDFLPTRQPEVYWFTKGHIQRERGQGSRYVLCVVMQPRPQSAKPASSLLEDIFQTGKVWKCQEIIFIQTQTVSRSLARQRRHDTKILSHFHSSMWVLVNSKRTLASYNWAYLFHSDFYRVVYAAEELIMDM